MWTFKEIYVNIVLLDRNTYVLVRAMKKNEKIKVTIDTLTGDGIGIGRVEDMAVFVPNTAVGETVLAHIIKVKKNYAIGKLLEVTVPSKDRIEIDCPAFKSCGGCAFRHISYEKELSFKQKGVEDAMRRIGGVNIESRNIIPSPNVDFYRNKAQYPIAEQNGQIVYGFFARHSHRVISSVNCKLQPKIFEKVMQTVAWWAKENNISVYNEETGRGLLRHLLIRYAEQSGEVMVVPVINGDTLPFADELSVALENILGNKFTLCYNVNKKDTNVVLGEATKTVYGKGYITDILCGVTLNISPHSFYQVNRLAAEILYKKAAEYIGDEDRVILDLYCGIGSIGLSLLKLCGEEKKLYGVEIVPEAVENAKENAKQNGFSDAEFFCADATKAAKMLRDKNIKPDLVVLDPPRKGCDAELINTVSNDFAPKKIIYISCDPATLARDTNLLTQNGYQLIEYTPVDLFPRTGHVETVAYLCRQTDVHNMKLNSSPFEMIKSGEKTIELRLFDEKRQQIKVGDRVIFTNTTNGETLSAAVLKLHRFNNFNELYKELPLFKIGYTKEDIDSAKPSDMEFYYSVEEQNKYGVLGIEISKL